MLESFRFHHLGVAVKSIERTVSVYEQGGYSRGKIIFDQIRNVNICWLVREGMPAVELVEPVDDNSVVYRTLGNKHAVPYHTCYVVDNIISAIEGLRGQHYLQVSEIEEAPAIHNCRICFMFNKYLGLIELVEAPATIVQ